MCRVLKVARAGFYVWLHNPVSAGEKDNQRLLELICDSYTLAGGTSVVVRGGTSPLHGEGKPAVAGQSVSTLYPDMWMPRHHGKVPFERYADDAVCRCHSHAQAQALMDQRYAQCGLELHPHKIRVVYCKDAERRGDYPETSSDFLDFTFRSRVSKNRYG